LHSIEAQPIHQALWRARLPNFTPKNRDISFMIFSIFIPYSFILERWYLVTWSTSLGGERQYTVPEALETNYSGQLNYTGQHTPMIVLPTGSCHHPFVVIIICQLATQLDKATTLTFF
jgi:hypothetical protein